MAEDSMTTQPAADAPAPADTQTPAVPDTAANTQPSPQPNDDLERRYKSAQAEMTRSKQELAEAKRLIAELSAAAEDEDEEAPAVRKVNRRSEREVALEQALEARDWQIAEAIYEPAVIDAYAVAAQMYNEAQTPADYIASFEAYHQRRVAGSSPQQAATAAGAPPPSAILPRADSNRSDAPVLPEIEQQLREAEKKRDLSGWVGAKLRLGQG